jgi:hypothetical protein
MLRQCTGLTKKGSKCKRTEKCQWHTPISCSICFEEIDKKYNTNCNHTFHEECILKWYQYSNGCPVCRAEQTEDRYIIFKKSLEDIISERYADAIRTLESDVTRLRRRLRAV